MDGRSIFCRSLDRRERLIQIEASLIDVVTEKVNLTVAEVYLSSRKEFSSKSSVRERRSMKYEVFRSAVLELLKEDKEWSVHPDWQEESAELMRVSGNGDELNDDYIELEQEKGPFYEFMTISVNRLYYFCMEDGWDAVTRELEKYTRRQNNGARRSRGIDYEARLNEEGADLYRILRELRSKISIEKKMPPYFVFMNRSLYEMCCRQPSTMSELREIYGVGEKNSGEYGEMFLEEIRKFTGGKKMQLMKMPVSM